MVVGSKVQCSAMHQLSSGPTDGITVLGLVMRKEVTRKVRTLTLSRVVLSGTLSIGVQRLVKHIMFTST